MTVKGDDIQDRLILFAARIIKVSEALPKTTAGKHIAGQLLRSGTSPAPHHAEARSAESSADFVHKLKIAVKELNESEVWLRIITQSELLPTSKLINVLDECDQLQRILSASIKTARKSKR
ncbi:MAG: four helix bundle protein [Chloroflexi bacterium]|nr:four helix bundle protein [Chloroflexota bacterium]